MRTAKILVIDDNESIRTLLQATLESHGFQPMTFSSGEEALHHMESELPSVVISDVDMPGMDGYEVCRQIRGRFANKIIPIILLTGRDPIKERVRGFEVGADEFLTKPFQPYELFVRVRSLVRIHDLHETVERQAARLEDWGKELEKRVAEQVQQLGQLKRFFSPQVAELISSSDEQNLIKLHRKDVSVAFFDLRGFTAFTERAKPDEVMSVLHEYYSEVGNLGLSHLGTIGRFLGDGMMFFFNDPIDVPRHGAMAVRMALAVREKISFLKKKWAVLGHELDFGAGIASGVETIGRIGFERCWDYSVIGVNTNTASRLCQEAQGGQILITDQFLRRESEQTIDVEPLGIVHLKGIEASVKIYNVIALRN